MDKRTSKNFVRVLTRNIARDLFAEIDRRDAMSPVDLRLTIAYKLRNVAMVQEITARNFVRDAYKQEEVK